VRMMTAAPLMFIFHYCQKNNSFYINNKDWPKFFAVSIFHIFIPFVSEFWSLQYVSSAKAAIIYSLTPFVAAIFSFLLLHKKLTIRQTAGLLIGLFGLLPIFLTKDQALLSHEFFSISLPEIALLVSVVSASYAWFLVSDLMQAGYGISLINGTAMLVGGILSFLTWLITKGHESPLHGDLSSFLFWTGLLIIVANLISYNLYGYILKRVSITFMSAIGFLCPIFASIYGLFLLGEDLNLNHLYALVLVCFGLWLFYRDELRSGVAVGKTNPESHTN
jgi:drug/metabolite transporter (DMT)-like permease